MKTLKLISALLFIFCIMFGKLMFDDYILLCLMLVSTLGYCLTFMFSIESNTRVE